MFNKVTYLLNENLVIDFFLFFRDFLFALIPVMHGNAYEM